MPLSPNDMERLLKAINSNTAALLTTAAMAAHKGKPGLSANNADVAAVLEAYETLLKAVLHRAMVA
ncbi:hypothetical protein [Candidatus Binatus sp.]|uniref:hypothetical protein n=1 Tax=Candidatus Binatus sp. TaxID=2811406 RepID=UPI003C72C995